VSTERPDNDATDPVEGPASGPVEDTVTGPAGDAVTGPAGAAADGSVGGPDEGTTDGTTAASAEAPGEHFPEGTVEGPGEGTVQGSGEGPAEGTVEGAAEGGAEGRAAGPGEGGVEGAAQGPGEDADQGSGAGPGAGAVERHTSGPDEVSGEDPGEGDSGSPAVGPTETTPAKSPLEDGAAASLLEASGAGLAEGSAAEGPMAGSPSEGSPDKHADGSLGGPLQGIVGGHVEGAGAGRARRRHTPAVVASVVAAVLLVGGGGAYFAATASGGGRSGTPGADGTPPRLALDGYVANTSGTGATGGTAGIAPGEPNPYGVTYRADGALPTGPGSAHIRWAEGRVTRAEVARLAKALDLAGTPRLVGDAWTVGTAGDGAEPNLRVNADAPGTWTFSSYILGTDNCAKGKTCRPVDSGSLAGTGPGPVSEAAAEKAAAPVLKAVGQGGAKLSASQLMGRVRVVNADPVVGGLPTYGWTTGLQVNGEGHVIGGSGQLKTPVEGDAYPVVPARKTLDLMNGPASATGDRRMGIGGCASPVPLKDRDEMPCEHPSPAPKPESATVEKATFGLAAHLANGRQALVPSWLFEVRSPGADDTYTVTHPAVDPKFLASASTASTASPTQPSTAPTTPPDEPSSPAATRDVDVQGYTADGRNLTVSFTGGVCADYTASASESAGKVTVTVTEKPWKNRICILIAKIYEKTVRLDAPLGGREVVGTDGKAVHHGSVEFPENSGTTSPAAR
jgi:hypothetical protein